MTLHVHVHVHRARDAFETAPVDPKYPVDVAWLRALPRTSFMSWAGFKHQLMAKLGVPDGQFTTWSVPGDWQAAWKAEGQRKFRQRG